MKILFYLLFFEKGFFCLGKGEMFMIVLWGYFFFEKCYFILIFRIVKIYVGINCVRIIFFYVICLIILGIVGKLLEFSF